MNDQAQKLTQDADTLRNNGRGKEAAEKYMEAAGIYERAGEKEPAAAAWHMAGVAYKVENDIPKAMKLYQKAAAIYQDLGSTLGVGRVMTDEGISYSYTGDFQKAVEVLHEAVKRLVSQDDLAALGIAQTKLAHNYWRTEDLTQADRWFEEGLRNIRRHGHWFFEMTTLFNWAEMDFAESRYDAALTKLWGALGLIYEEKEAAGQERRLAQIKGLIANCYLELGNTKFAARFMGEALALLAPMSRESAEVVYGDIKAEEFLRKLKEKYPSSNLSLPENFRK